ncbi:MAG TPA: TlpA disulfide reductase family protein [Chitinophagaceae bacterium]|nr:TlpA disulfide reductase family protein [Chitinophagaceae bacterium]
MKLFIKPLVSVVFIITACNDSKKQESKPVSFSQIEVEKVKLTSLAGKPIEMKQYKGKTVFINFWATWCKPCLEEMPTIKKAMGFLEDEKIEFLFASDESTEEIHAFETEHSYGLYYTRAGNIEELNIIGLPTTFIFDKDGKQVFSEMGYRKWDDKANIDLLLKIAKPE